MDEVHAPETDAAIELVGTKRVSRGFALNPHDHLGRLPDAAASLRYALTSPPVAEAMRRYERFDQLAVERQSRFKRLCFWTILAVALLTYAAMLALGLPLSEDAHRIARLWALIALYGAICVAFVGLSWLHLSRPDVGWREARAAAEVERARIFDAVMGFRRGDKEDKTLLPLKLEYVRRYQLDLQEDYYEHRGAQHRQRVHRAFMWKLIFFLIAMFAVGAMFVIHFADKGENGISFASRLELVSGFLLNLEAAYTDLVLLMSALALALWWAASHTLAQIDGAARNAALFGIAHKKLLAFRKARLEAAREAAANGDDASVQKFVDDLQAILTGEHQGWIALEGLSTNEPNTLSA